MGQENERPEGRHEKKISQRRRSDARDSRKRRRSPVLTHSVRLAILSLLDDEPRTLQEIAELMRSSVALETIQYHLYVLRQAGKVDKPDDGYVIRRPEAPPQGTRGEGPSRQA